MVFVDPMDKAVVKREGWWPAIVSTPSPFRTSVSNKLTCLSQLVPRAEYDETMPKAGRSELIVRYFEDRS